MTYSILQLATVRNAYYYLMHNSKGSCDVYNNAEVRSLTIQDSKTNQAHHVWYSLLTPMERLEIANKIHPNLKGIRKLNACLNYVEDHIESLLGAKK